MGQPDWEGFGRAVMRCWPEGDVDGGYLQDLAIGYDLIREEPYSVEKHGPIGRDEWDVDEGDPWYVRNYEEEE